MKKINYIETENSLSARGDGFEFHYRPLTDDDGESFVPGEPVAWLLLDGWYNNKSKPIRVRIHPVSSPRLTEMGEKPEVIVTEVKEAIELFLKGPERKFYGQIADHIWVWVNA